MSLRDRTKKRLRYFVVAVVLLGCAGVGAYVLRERHLESTTRAGRDEGLKQLEAGDYFHAMHNIGPYLRRHPDDVESLLAYATARRQVPEPNNRHISDALGLLRRVLVLNPQHVQASESLLELYQQCGLMTEGLQLAQQVLSVHPKNAVAMKVKATALNAGGKSPGVKPEDALNTALRYAELWPRDVAGQLLVMEILDRGDTTRERAVAHFAKLHEKSPNDPLAILLLGVAHLTSGDSAAASKWIGQAAQLEMPDVPAVELLVRACDQLEMFEQSMNVLKRHAGRADGDEFVALFAGRLWELESYQQLADHVGGKAIERDAQAAALRCLALRELGQKEKAAAALEALKQAAESNPSARDWAAVLEALNAGATPDDAAIIRACQQSLRVKDNPYLRFLLGEAYMRIGDTDAAVQAWIQVTAQAPAWAAPILRLTQVVAAVGDLRQSRVGAERALKRAPGNVRAMLALAAVRAAALKSDETAAANEILALLDRVEQTAPTEHAALLLRVRVLATTGRVSEAVAVARRALEPGTTASAPMLMKLAALSEELKLSLEQELYARCEGAHGLSPQLALRSAKKEVDAGNRQQALQLVDRARAAAKPADKPEWDAAWARILEATGDHRAKDAWIALADANPTNAQVQWDCLGAPSVQDDRASRRRVLDRLKEQYGDRGFRWRLTHAHWLLAGREENAQNAVEAALVLNELTRDAPNMVAPKLLLAECQVQLGQVPGAIQQLTAAALLQPRASGTSLKLARLLQSRGDFARARSYLDRVAQDAAAPRADRREAAELINDLGDPAAALAALEGAYGATLNDPPADMLLADLYRRNNQPQRAEAICKRLLETPDAGRVAFVVDFYASQGRAADATKALEALDKLPAAKPGEKEIVRGSLALRLGDRAKAAAEFEAATRAAPANALAWRQLIRIQLAGADNEKALSTARLAQAAISGDAGFAAFVRQAPQVFKLQSNWPEIRNLWGDLLATPDLEKALTELADLLPPPADAQASLPGRAVNRLTAMASENPRVLPLQFLAARACLMSGRAEDATRIASRAALASPDKATPGQFAVTTLAAVGNWPEVLEMAKQWRQATPLDTLAADQMIAVAHAALGNDAAARDALTPHLARALAEPEKYRLLISDYAILQARLASPEAAAELLRPRLKESAAWRLTWMRLAGGNLPVPAALAWLKEVEPLALKGDFVERLTLADCWHAVGQKSKDSEHTAHGAALLTRLMDDPQAAKLSADEMTLIASLQASYGNAGGAEASYRRALALNPQHAIAQNNLAMILATNPGALDEALALANQAVNAAPTGHRAGVYDTLAFVQGQRGDYAGAIASIQQALLLKPNEPKYQVRLAIMLIGNQQVDRARALLDELKSRPGISPQVEREVQELQKRVEQTSAPRSS